MPSAIDHELETLIRARYPIVYIVSWEEERVEDSLRAISRERNKKLHVWTVTQGFVQQGGQRETHAVRGFHRGNPAGWGKRKRAPGRAPVWAPCGVPAACA